MHLVVFNYLVVPVIHDRNVAKFLSCDKSVFSEWI